MDPDARRKQVDEAISFVEVTMRENALLGQKINALSRICYSVMRDIHAEGQFGDQRLLVAQRRIDDLQNHVTGKQEQLTHTRDDVKVIDEITTCCLEQGHDIADQLGDISKAIKNRAADNTDADGAIAVEDVVGGCCWYSCAYAGWHSGCKWCGQ